MPEKHSTQKDFHKNSGIILEHAENDNVTQLSIIDQNKEQL